jgi:hypothetical protein
VFLVFCNLDIIDILNQVTPFGEQVEGKEKGDCSMHCKRFVTTAGLYPHDAVGTPQCEWGEIHSVEKSVFC